MSFSQPITTEDGWFVGEDKELEVIVYQPGTTLAQALADTGVRQNVTGWTVQWALRKSQHGGVVILAKTASIVGAAVNGRLRVTIDHADTTALTPGRYFHTFARIDSGEQTVLAYGTATLRRAAIR